MYNIYMRQGISYRVDSQRIGYEREQLPFSAFCNEFACVFYLRKYVTIELSQQDKKQNMPFG
jgi:hypothetical protein